MAADKRGDCLWVVTGDVEFRNRVEQELTERGCRVRHVPHDLLDTHSFWKNCPRYPGAVLLDVSERLDWATTVLKEMKRTRVPSPIIVATTNPSREFGTKIVSLGVSYFLPHDFTPGELAEVFISLVKPRTMQF